MPTILKVIFGVFAAVVVLVVVAAAAILVLVDPADYKDEIAVAIEGETGRSARIEGDISLSLFPTIGLEVAQITLGNPPGFAAEPFLEIGSAALGARVLPLLSRRLEVTTLRLEGLRLNLQRRADGSTNWAGLGEPDGDAGRGAPRQPGQAQGELGRIAGLEVRDVRVRYTDEASGRVVVAGIPRLSTGAIVPGESFPLEAEATLDLDDGAVRMQADLALVAAGPGSGDVAEFRDLELQLDFSGAAVPGGAQSARLAVPRLALDGRRQVLDLPAAVLEAAGLQATLALQGEALGQAPVFTGRLELAEFSPRAALESLGMPPPVTRDPDVLQRAALETGLRVADGEVTLDDLRATLDDSALTGRLAVAGGEVTRVTGALALDQLDLDRYAAPPADEGTPATAADEPLVFDWLRALALDLGLEAGSLRVSGLALGPVRARVVAGGGRLVVEPLRADLYEGEARGRAELDARKSPATLRLRQSLAGLAVQPFVSDLADFARLTGIANLEADLTASAATTAGLVRGLNGTVGFELSDGALQGINLWYEIQRAYALAKGRPVPERTSPDTEFRQLAGTAVIRDGKLVNDDLSGGLPMLALAGSGAIDLADGTLDYRLTATVMREAVDEATGERSELAGTRIPLRLSGELGAPKVSVDVEELLKERAVEEIKERLRDPLEKLRERLRPDG
ncbi:AsmA family protein [Thioalkalivibrio sp. XN8]|uniref:AsmA family protein n=1 Tax=Thioalkalivibrio sp. XN8 TaxID=2712863 RepID=UPI0013EDAAEC|nr:AsmA family protein [Thioalkalivibrio sp. XN8]NGP53371.1 AsmA family protein [Thioalkalivibrio sp. XN8]